MTATQPNISITPASFSQAALNGDPSSGIAQLDDSWLRLPVVTRACFSPKVVHLTKTKTASGSYCNDMICAPDLAPFERESIVRSPHPAVHFIPPPNYDWSSAMGKVLARKVSGPLDSPSRQRDPFFPGPPVPASLKRLLGFGDQACATLWEMLQGGGGGGGRYHGWDGRE